MCTQNWSLKKQTGCLLLIRAVTSHWPAVVTEPCAVLGLCMQARTGYLLPRHSCNLHVWENKANTQTWWISPGTRSLSTAGAIPQSRNGEPGKPQEDGTQAKAVVAKEALSLTHKTNPGWSAGVGDYCGNPTSTPGRGNSTLVFNCQKHLFFFLSWNGRYYWLQESCSVEFGEVLFCFALFYENNLCCKKTIMFYNCKTKYLTSEPPIIWLWVFAHGRNCGCKHA